METTLILIAYAVYLPVVIALTWYVARTLFNNGKIFMLDIFNQRQEIALSTNQLFKVGFYLLNMGFALMILEINKTVETNQVMVEVLSYKIGGFSIYLGVMLFFNMYLFFRGRSISKERARVAALQAQQATRVAAIVKSHEGTAGGTTGGEKKQ
jgi:hypothetical protein